MNWAIRNVRILLGCATILIVLWAFGFIGGQLWKRHQSEKQYSIQLTVLHWGDHDEERILDSLLAEYMQKHPKVLITRINANDFESKIKTMMSAGTPPDMFYLRPDLFPELATLKLVRPIDDYVAADRAAGKGAYFDDFYPILLDAFRFDTEKQRIGSGKLYGLPKDFTTAVYYVNVDLFKKAGVEVPYKGWTWEEFEVAMKKITALNPPGKTQQIYGGYFPLWPDTLRQIVWSYGGDFFGPGGFRDPAFGSPQTQAALAMICRTRFVDHSVYNPTGVAKDGGQEFFNGNIGCIGPLGRWQTPRNSDITAFKWDVVPAPYAKKELQVSQMFYTAWSMSSQTPHPEECYEVMKFLCGPDGATMQSRLGLAIPPLKSIAQSKDFLNPGPPIPADLHSNVFIDLIPYLRLQQTPQQGEWNRIVSDIIISRCTQLQLATPEQAATEVKKLWLDELDSPLRRQEWQPMNWKAILAIVAAIAVPLLLVGWFFARRAKIGSLDRALERTGWSFISPWVIGFAVFTFGPMLVSLILSFSKWTGMTPIHTADYVGFANFEQIFTRDPKFVNSLLVTGYFAILAVPVFQLLALVVALLMNNKIKGIEIFRTIYFVPSVIGGAAGAVLWTFILNNDYGVLNTVLRPILSVFGTQPPNWLGSKVWAIPAFVVMGLWGVGSGMILYLAGLKGIPTSLYEAATIDGASSLRKFWNVTLPMLSPIIFFNLVMGIIGSFQIFTQAYIMTGGGPDNATNVYILNLYRHAFEFHNMGYASALAWILFLIVLLITVLVFRGARSLVYYEGLKS